jgi:hypothetical protein
MFIQRGVLHIALENFEKLDSPSVAKNHSEIDEEPSLEQTSTKLSLNRRRPIRIADAGSGKV